MSPFSEEPVSAGMPSLDETLRLVAHAPLPDGLADRVQARLDARSASTARRGRVLAWPVAPVSKTGSNWMRTAAAAAIVFVVAGGGWGVYSRIQPWPAAKGAVPIPHVAAPGGFSNAGAMRTPQTLNGPVLTHPGASRRRRTLPPSHLRRQRRSIFATPGPAQPTRPRFSPPRPRLSNVLPPKMLRASSIRQLFGEWVGKHESRLIAHSPLFSPSAATNL